MKQFILIVFLLLPFAILAQNVDKNGNIKSNGKNIGRIEKSNGFPKRYSLYDANNKEIVSFEPNGKSSSDFRYKVTFLRTDNKGECPGNIAFHKKIAKAFVNSNLVKDGVYQYKRESRFMSSISGGIYWGGNVDVSSLKQKEDNRDNDLLERNRDAMIQVFGNTVKQDFKKIASVKKSQRASEGTIIQRIKILNHKGKLIAEAVGRGVNTTTFEVTTLKDNHTQTIQADSFINVVKDIVTTLVADYYL